MASKSGGWGNSMNFRNSDCVTAHANYFESVDSAMRGEQAVSDVGASVW